jgi:DNA-binding NarL/FixJ family response regulator
VIQILVVDDIAVIRAGLCAILSQTPEFTVVAEAANGWEAIEMAKRYQPDVVLLDISMPELNGLQAAPLIKQAAPVAHILIVTQHNNQFLMRAAFPFGVDGYLDKKDAGIELQKAVKDVFSQKTFVSQSLQTSFKSPTTQL